MKKIMICALGAFLLALTLCSCGAKCNMCEKGCSSKYSYRDGEVVICSSCYEECFENKNSVDPDEFFAAE